MMNLSGKAIFLLTVFFLLAAGCKRDRFNVNVSKVEPGIKIIRFEEVLFSADPATIEQYIPTWQEEYGDFFANFCAVTGLGEPGSPGFAERLKAFVTDKSNYIIYSRTHQVFEDLNKVTADLNEAFRHYLHYFPGKPVPSVFTFISGFSRSAITDDNLLCIGLDRYLGKDEILYKQAGIYSYLTNNMHPQKIVSDCMNFWGETEFMFNDSINNLITNMIFRGRLLYFTSAMIPGQNDTINWGFTGKDLNYLKESEKSMWAFLIEHKLLFNTDRFTINKYIMEGPFTTDFGRGSPSRSAVWIGYRITEAYMERNPDTDLGELMQERDYMKILNGSGYNP